MHHAGESGNNLNGRGIMRKEARLLYIINADWYFRLHWLDRAVAARNAGYDVHVACQVTEDQVRREIEDAGLTCHPFEMTRSGLNPLEEARSFRTLQRLVKAISPRLIHTITVKPNLYGGLIGRQSDIPTVASVTGLGSVFASKRPHHRVLAKAILLGCRYLSSGSRFFLLFENKVDHAMFLESGAAKAARSMVVSGAGVDTELFRYRKPQKHVSFRVLFAARLIQEKGLELLVEAVANLRARGCGVELWVAGISDPTAQHPISEEQLDAWQSAGLIRYLGKRDDMADLLADVDVVCLPTMYREGIPRILIEAGAVGRPVITTDVAGCSELVTEGRNGRLVKAGSVAEIEQAILDLAQSYETVVSMSKNARKNIEEGFSNQRVIVEHLGIYANMIGDDVHRDGDMRSSAAASENR